MSLSTILPLNLADTGPIFNEVPMLNWLSPVTSMRSQPGMQAFKISGLFSASHACCCVTLSWRVPCMSIGFSWCDG